MTYKKMFEEHDFVFVCGYCKLQNLLSREVRSSYISNRYGWRCDIYSFEVSGIKFAICTGYSPKGIEIPYDICKLYETKAEEIIEESLECKDALRGLINGLLGYMWAKTKLNK